MILDKNLQIYLIEKYKNNSLEKCNPELTIGWDFEKNGDLKPTMLSQGSSEKIWWICEKGHSYSATIRTRSGCKCPYCSGRKPIAGVTDLKSTDPDLIKEWDYEKNPPLMPEEVSRGSAKKAWWICSNGHSYSKSISSRVHGASCPYCSGKLLLVGFNDLEFTHPRLAEEWNYELNGDKTPSNTYYKDSRKVWWVCPEGHSYSMRVVDRTEYNKDCPYCCSP